MEGVVAESMGRSIRARNAGVVEYADSEKIVVKLPKKIDDLMPTEDIEVEGGIKETYYTTKFNRTSRSTCYDQRVLVRPGDIVKKGALLGDGPASEYGELALGRNLTVAYMSFEGYGFEDSILISDKLVKEDLMTSIHIEEYEAEVVDTKLGPEQLTRDIPNISEGDLSNLAEDGIVVVGVEVGPNDVLVGKIAPKGETELTSEERLLRAIFGEKAREVRDTSLRVPHGERGIVVDVAILDRDKGDELGPGVLKKVIVRIAQIRKIEVGDKVAGRHGNKGVVVKIMPAADMPYLDDGTPVDLIISPLSVLARMNLGQLLEVHLGWALSKKGQRAALPVFDRIGEDVIERELKEAGLPLNGKAQLYDGRTGEPFKEQTVVGIGYMLKLSHMVEDKVHARSTGPYSLVTQQPLGGKAQMGGQRLGEMEVWGLEAHRAAYTLQEMMTIKSDDVQGRARAFEAIVKGIDIPEATMPESFRVLVRELNSLGLNIEAKGAKFVSDEEEFEEKEPLPTKEAEELAAILEAKEVATGELLNPVGPMEVEEMKEGV
jgi:DNA-directed RNA polymerase subunit beta